MNAISDALGAFSEVVPEEHWGGCAGLSAATQDFIEKPNSELVVSLLLRGSMVR
jgi:hypothetical protein